MARSRNLKPGLFSNELLGAGDPLAQLLFAGLPCLADREGRLDALIEDLYKGHGASRGKGGRPKKGEGKNMSGTTQVNGTGRGGAHSKRVNSLAARLAESTEPKLHAAWQGYLDGKFRSVTAAAIACGLVEDSNAPLNRLKQNWKKASKTERKAFLAWIKEAGDA